MQHRDEVHSSLAIGDVGTFDDGLRLTVADLRYYAARPGFLDDDLDGPAVRFRLLVRNKSTQRFPLKDLDVHVRCGAEGVPASAITFDPQLRGPLTGELLPGKSATADFGYQISDEEHCAVDVTIDRGWRGDEGSLHWSGEPGPAAAAEVGPTKSSGNEHLLAEAAGELDSLIGLGTVKAHVHMLASNLRFDQFREARELPRTSGPHHLVFTGPPGTGKTTVARIIGKTMAGLGLLERGHVVECDRSGLVGKYVGHTASKTNAKIDEALGGVLFVDEAYALANPHSLRDGFGDEALQTLLKRAEDERHQLVVVLAGYPQEMDLMLASNPGLASRFSTHIDFSGFGAIELAAVFRARAAVGRDVLSADAESELTRLTGVVENEGWGDALGHARFARSWCDRARGYRAVRVLDTIGDRDPDEEELTVLCGADLTAAFADLTPPRPSGTGGWTAPWHSAAPVLAAAGSQAS